MSSSMDPLDRLGKALADAQDEQLRDGRHLARARVRLLASGTRRGGPGKLVWIGLPAAAALMAAAALLVVLRMPRALSFTLGDGAQQGEIGAWIAAPAQSALPLSFSDGTRVDLEPESRARVVEADSRAARVVLERGRARFDVRPGRGGQWLVDVGPYRVLVTGTRFDVGWEPTAERFALRLEQGTVRVSGPLIGADRPVSAGESVAADGKLGRVEILDDRGGVGASSAPAPAPVGPTASASSPATPPSGAFPAPEPSSPRPAGWRELAAAGRYKDALGAAERAGFEAECASASASDLVALGDAARLGGNAGRAAQALLALRSRFPGDGRSATAAFTLGRIAFDQRRSPCEAARWFDAYLREQGGGAFAREAAGRLIEARRACGDAAGAREAAKRYLSRFPNGPHAELARSLPPE